MTTTIEDLNIEDLNMKFDACVSIVLPILKNKFLWFFNSSRQKRKLPESYAATK